MADIVFILGAGASVDCGAPISTRLLNAADDLRRDGKVSADSAHFDAVERARRLLGRVHTKADLDLDNVESVFSALDMAETLRALPGHDPDAIPGVVESLKRVIVRTLEESIRFRNDDGRPILTTGYKVLADRILMHRQTTRFKHAIITFNCDVALEVALNQVHLPFVYGLKEQEQDNMPVLKLHGSLNWFRRKDGSDVFACTDFAPATRFDIPKQRDEPARIALRFSDAREKLLGSEGDKYEEVAFIVPPTWSKGEHYRSIRRVWQRAARELHEAQHIYILGYSLPETDQFFRLLFALGTAEGPTFREILVGNPDGRVVDRVRQLLGMQARQCIRNAQSDLRLSGEFNQVASYLEVGLPK